MRVTYVTESHEASAGGITTVVDQLARHILAQGVDVEIVSVGTDPLAPPPGSRLTNVLPSRLSGPWRWSPKLMHVLREALSDGSRIVHLHGIWLASQWSAARRAERLGIPVVLSAHGQLEPYHWHDKGTAHFLKKKAYWHLMALPAFRSIQVVHAITPREKDHLHSLMRDHRIVLIPNAVDLAEIDRTIPPVAEASRKQPVIGFLGRFHPKKGIDLLIEAFAAAELPSEWRLVLAGPAGGPRYMKKLTELVSRSPVRDRISFVGTLVGDAKWRFLREATVIAVPSLSEVIGMVNLEAAACGTPTITTHETGLDDWESGGGALIRPEVRDLALALSEVCSLNATEYARRTIAARRLVESRYAWAVVGRLWLDLYQTLLRSD
jgi:glycosyltransferase involved in cell wall biosynthesis